ncbi:MAG: PAS domain S-box protein [Calditrichaeota bacterium]|nr:MAG: PAS domain S-box protein [Calditrichota bacterium]
MEGKKQKTILFVDDDPDMLEIGGIMLRKAGYDYLSASSGEEGLSVLLASKPDLVILDYMMPGMNGFEFFKQMRQHPKYKPVRLTPVIMLTAYSEKEIERQALFEMGLSAFLLKPFGNRELVNVIDNVFILHELRVKNKELQEQVKRTEYKYQDLIENASDMIFTLNREARFVFINRRLTSITGHSRGDWLSKRFVDLIVPEDRETANQNVQKTITGKASIFEVRCCHTNGKRVHLSININPIFERGQVVGCVGIARDITEKKQLEQEIIELKNFNESIIQSMGSGLITIDFERRVTSFNQGAEEMLGYAAEDVVGKPLESLFPKEDCERLLSNVDDPDRSLLNREMQLGTKNGHSIYVGFTATPRFDTQGRRVGAIISFKDITQIKQMQSEVQRMDRLASMGVLASGIAHEIRNPLAGIKTIAQTLEEDIEPDDSRREYVSRIVRQVNRMDDLLKTIFSYAKPREPQRKYHRLQEIVQEVVALLENRMRSQSVEFVESYHPELPLAYVDFYQIQQVFVNLFLNALDAMPDGGTLKLDAHPKVTTLHRVDRRGRPFTVQNKSALYVQVLLSDTGVGIQPSDLPSIFNPFFTTKPQGSGLGLSIVYRIMTEHNGDIQVNSEMNKGTTFSLLLPTEE